MPGTGLQIIDACRSARSQNQHCRGASRVLPYPSQKTFMARPGAEQARVHTQRTRALCKLRSAPSRHVLLALARPAGFARKTANTRFCFATSAVIGLTSMHDSVIIDNLATSLHNSCRQARRESVMIQIDSGLLLDILSPCLMDVSI